MVLIKDGIEKVRAFEIPVGIRENGRSTAAVRMALVRWSVKGGLEDKFYQVYINGKYAGTTIDNQQRHMIIQIPSCFTSPAAIEVFAVDEEHADCDFSSEIEPLKTCTGRVKISILRNQSFPVGSTVQFYFDNGTGQIDYDNPLNVHPVQIWPAWRYKSSFGMSSFGFSDFGYDGSATVGMGKGDFGKNPFGLDTDAIEWISKPLPSGVYKFAAKITNSQGYESSTIESGPVTVIASAKPAEQLDILSYDKQANQLVLSVS